MTRRLFWKLCLIIGTGVVAMFYLINVAVNHFENDMSMLSDSSRTELTDWQTKAEIIFDQGDMNELERWVDNLQQQENIWAVIAKANVVELAGNRSHRYEYTGYNLGRSIDWKIHLYFDRAPAMQLPFKDGTTSLVVQLPQRMRPGSLWNLTRLSLQVLLPMSILVCLSIVLYRHIMHPIKELDLASRAFSKGDFSVRVREQLGSRNDELSQLAETFDLKKSTTLLTSVKSNIESRLNQLTQTSSQHFSSKYTRSKYVLMFHQQYSWAMICIVFLFIGAPLGSIVRKGGYGYPLLVAIVFFMLFIVLSIMGDKLNRAGTIHPILAAWLPNLVIIPIAFVLTYKALNDSDFSFVKGKITQLKSKFMSASAI